MTPNEFCAWLQGTLEFGQLKRLNPEQLSIVKEKLSAVRDEDKKRESQLIDSLSVTKGNKINPTREEESVNPTGANAINHFVEHVKNSNHGL